jgi:hypothetical protein
MDFQVSEEFANKSYHVTMPDGRVWAVPLLTIALNRAQYYMQIDGVSLNESLNNDTIPMFEDPDEVADWAQNNMDWDDVKDVAKLVHSDEPDYQEGWVNGDYEVV